MFWYYQPIGPSATFLDRLFQVNIQFIVFTTLGSSPIYQHLYTCYTYLYTGRNLLSKMNILSFKYLDVIIDMKKCIAIRRQN